MMKMNRYFAGILIVLTVLTVSAQVDSYAASYYSNKICFSGRYRPALRWASPISGYPSIVSKWNQTRSIGTNPHQGVDLQASYGTSVRAVYPGWLISKNIYTAVLRIDVNRNGKIDKGDNLYCHYYHLSKQKPQGYYNKGDVIAQSGNEGGAYAPHLHFGGVNTSSLDGKRWYRNAPFYAWNKGNWNAGSMIDTYSKVQFNKNKFSLCFYFKDERGNITPSEVKLFYRKAGRKKWNAAKNMKRGASYTYSYNFNKIYPAGTKINVLVRGKRPGLGNVYPYAWAPAKYERPQNNPNKSNLKYSFYKYIIK